MSQATAASATSSSASSSNIPTLSDSSASSVPKVKPCCVCKDEKAKRDECMLFSNSDSKIAPEEGECKPLVDRYRECMRGFGFSLP